MHILQEAPDHAALIAQLHNDVLGPGRFARAAERLREGNRPLASLCLVALDPGGTACASVRCWPVRIGAGWPSVLLGPLAVAGEVRDQGYGLALLRKVSEAATAAGEARVILVGDEPYYARAGFERLDAGAIRMPGPIDPKRLLGLALQPGAFESAAGRIAADPVRA